MNPQYAASQLSQYGRGGDTTLMHVQPREMQGIATLLGRPLTQNPQTGLPEAFGWQDILPVIAGIAGTVISGGNPLIGAAAAGATKTATTGDLSQGILTGITSYATAGLASGLAEAGAAATAGGVGGVAGDVAGSTIGSTAGGAAGGVGSLGGAGGVAGSAIPAAAVEPAASAAMAAPIQAEPLAPLAGSTAASDYNAVMPAAQQIAAPPMGGVDQAAPVASPASPAASPLKASQMTAGQYAQNIGNALSDPRVAMNYVQQNPMQAAIGIGGTAMSLAGSSQPQPRPRPPGLKYNPTAPREWWTPPAAGYNSNPGNGFITTFAKGGVASLDGGRFNAGKNLIDEATAALLGEHPRPREALSRFQEVFGPAMLEGLRERVTGGRVRGSGGGLDDLVPGTIEGRQRVRLADGEFVVSSDVVSALGDGSTDQGARKLHEMMDRVRKSKTGRERQPGPLPRNALPA